jgi:hypothetical protein
MSPNFYGTLSATAFETIMGRQPAILQSKVLVILLQAKWRTAMITWVDFEVSLEQHQERLRRAEKQRLIEQFNAAAEKSGVWKKVKLAFSGKQPADSLVANDPQPVR